MNPIISGAVTLNTVNSDVQVQLPYYPNGILVHAASTNPDHSNGRMSQGFINTDDFSQWALASNSNGNESDVDNSAGVLVIDSSGNPVVRAIATDIDGSNILHFNVTNAASIPVYLTLLRS